MKRQLDRLKGKRLVTGDPNLMTKDEICINATPSGVEVKEIGTDGKIKDLAGSGGGGNEDSEDKYVYYIPNNESVNFNIDGAADLYELLNFIQNVTGVISSKVYVRYKANMDKFKDGYYLYSLPKNLNCHGIRINNDLFIQIPSYENNGGSAYAVSYIGFNGTFDEMCEIYKLAGMDFKPIIEQYFKRCTKEEFYKDVLMYDLTYEDVMNNLNQ